MLKLILRILLVNAILICHVSAQEDDGLDYQSQHENCETEQSPCENVCVVDSFPESDVEHAYRCGYEGVWLPEDPPLFRPFIADPRQVCYSIGWRFNDQALVQNVIDVSYGDTLPVYQWWDVWPWNGRMQVDIEGALWAVFSPLQESAPLINADYYVAIPITYAIQDWQFRLRVFHISSHIGDEFLINHLGRGFNRLNPSAEYLDFFVSNDFTEDIRLYGGLGYVMHYDETFPIGRFYAEWGLELRLRALQFVDNCKRIYGVPILGMDFQWRRDYKRHLNSTYVLGYEFGKLSGLQRRLRFFIEYHDGYSVEGQFCRYASNYLSIRASYGF
jgi:Protein of unknown function (DUF1207)